MSRHLHRALVLTALVPVAFATPLVVPAAQATGAPHCAFAQLTITEGHSDSGLGHIMFPIHFKNTSGTACTLYGYPGAAGLNKHGQQVVQAQRVASGYTGGLKPGNPIPLVTLEPGQVATARIEGSDVPGPSGHTCRELRGGLLVTPPNDKRSAHLKYSPPSCRLQIHPVIKGKSGTQKP